jgi:hypothetical protein
VLEGSRISDLAQPHLRRHREELPGQQVAQVTDQIM